MSPCAFNRDQTTAMPKKETLTPRQRVIQALNHQIPDRVPIDLGGNQTGIHKNAYRALLQHLGIRDEITIMDAVQQLAKPCEQVLQRFHVDTRYVAQISGELEEQLPGWKVLVGPQEAGDLESFVKSRLQSA